MLLSSVSKKRKSCLLYTSIPMKFLEEGKTEEEIRTYMQKTYFASDEKIDLSIDIAERELEILKKIDYENGYSCLLYTSQLAVLEQEDISYMTIFISRNQLWRML